MSAESIYRPHVDPDEKPEGSVTERIARLRKSLSGEKLATWLKVSSDAIALAS